MIETMINFSEFLVICQITNTFRILGSHRGFALFDFHNNWNEKWHNPKYRCNDTTQQKPELYANSIYGRSCNG